MTHSRVLAFRAFVVLFALAALVPGFGLADLTTPLNPIWDEGYVAEVGYGALAGILIPVGFLAQLRAPERRIAGLQQVAAAVPAYIIAGALGGDDDFLPFAAIVAAATAVAVGLHPARSRFLAGGRFRPVLALLALAMAAPAFLYGLEAAANQRDGVPPLALDSHGPLNSWAALAAAAFAVALVALLASFGTEGFPIPGWSAWRPPLPPGARPRSPIQTIPAPKVAAGRCTRSPGRSSSPPRSSASDVALQIREGANAQGRPKASRPVERTAIA